MNHAPYLYGPVPIHLSLVAEFSDETLCWEFNEFLVLKDKGGRLYWGDDGGCSCYGGFNFDDNLTSGDRQALFRDFDSWNPYDGHRAIAEKEKFVRKMTEAGI